LNNLIKLKKEEVKVKLKLILTCAMVAILLPVCACSSQVSVEVSCDDFIKLPPEERAISKEIEVPVDSSFTVTLCSNPTTGFQWESAKINDQAVLRQTDHKFVPPEAKGDRPPAPGTPGKEVWTFKALKKGTCSVSMKYSRPWEGSEKGAWTFNLSVVAK
jgi:inhibitor of cysteine peptidase